MIPLDRYPCLWLLAVGVCDRHHLRTCRCYGIQFLTITVRWELIPTGRNHHGVVEPVVATSAGEANDLNKIALFRHLRDQGEYFVCGMVVRQVRFGDAA